MEIYAYIGAMVRHRRTHLELTQAQLAEDAGLTRSTLANLEIGRQQVPLEQLISIGRALRMDYRELLPPPETIPIPGRGPITAETVEQRAPGTAEFIARIQRLRPDDEQQA